MLPAIGQGKRETITLASHMGGGVNKREGNSNINNFAPQNKIIRLEPSSMDNEKEELQKQLQRQLEQKAEETEKLKEEMKKREQEAERIKAQLKALSN